MHKKNLELSSVSDAYLGGNFGGNFGGGGNAGRNSLFAVVFFEDGSSTYFSFLWHLADFFFFGGGGGCDDAPALRTSIAVGVYLMLES